MQAGNRFPFISAATTNCSRASLEQKCSEEAVTRKLPDRIADITVRLHHIGVAVPRKTEGNT
jgi:hypothetical protein